MHINIIDKYLIKQFIIALSGALFFMLGLFLISLFIDNLKYFLKPAVPSSLVFQFVIYKVPEIINQVLPAAVLFSTSYVFGNLNTTNEIIAIYNGGTGFIRLMTPLVLTGMMISALSFFFFEYVSVDASNMALERKNIIKKLTGKNLYHIYSRNKFFLMGDNNTVYYIQHFLAENGIMIKPVITRFDNKGNIKFQITAEKGTYNKESHLWDFETVSYIGVVKDGRLKTEKRDKLSLELDERPKNFMKSDRTIMQMRLNEAVKFINEKREKGGDYRKYLVELQWRFAFPFSIIIVIFIGSVIGIYFRKAVLVLSFFLSIVLSFGYYGLLALGLAFGKSGQLEPIASAWIANIIYLIIALLAIRFKK